MWLVQGASGCQGNVCISFFTGRYIAALRKTGSLGAQCARNSCGWLLIWNLFGEMGLIWHKQGRRIICKISKQLNFHWSPVEVRDTFQSTCMQGLRMGSDSMLATCQLFCLTYWQYASCMLALLSELRLAAEISQCLSLVVPPPPLYWGMHGSTWKSAGHLQESSKWHTLLHALGFDPRGGLYSTA